MEGVSKRATAVAFVVASVLGGGNAVGVRFSNQELEPFWGAGIRFAIAATLLLGISAFMRLPIPKGRDMGGAAIYGVLNIAAAFALAYYGLQEVHAGFGQILLSIVPLATFLLAVVERQEKFRWAGILGGLIALVGVLIMSPAALDEAVPLRSILAMIGAAFCFAQAAVAVPLFPKVHPVQMNAYGMALGAILLLLASLVAGEARVMPEQTDTLWAIAYLAAVGSVVVFVLYVLVIKEWGASRASYSLVLVPPFTVLFSVWLLDEPVGWELLLGGAIVLFGVWVGALRHAD